MVSLLAMVLFSVATVVRLPYYAISPGTLHDAGALIELSGQPLTPADPSGAGEADDLEAHRGRIAFATISLDGRVNLLQAASAWLDGNAELVEEDLILRGRTPTDNRLANQQMMAGSQDAAVRVALVALGLAEPIGAEIAVVLDGSPASGVLSPGDVVVTAHGRPVNSLAELAAELNTAVPGEQVDLTVAPNALLPADRARRQRTGRAGLEWVAEPRTIIVGRDVAEPARPYLGVGARDALWVTTASEVSLAGSDVGGPSAGLAFTLAVIDKLSPGDLTGGEAVAATGTIDDLGRVGPIGGIEQKAAAARRAGITVFLVPDSLDPGELARARSRATGVELVPVGSLGQALEALAERGGSPVALAAGAGALR